MPRKTAQNGRDRLDEAMALLINNQAAFVSELARSDRDTRERFARIEAQMDQIIRVLTEQGRELAALRADIRGSFGFRPPETTA